MLFFDHYVITTLAGYSQRSEIFNKFVVEFLTLSSIRFLPLIALLWVLWFQRSFENREKVAGGYCNAFAKLRSRPFPL